MSQLSSAPAPWLAVGKLPPASKRSLRLERLDRTRSSAAKVLIVEDDYFVALSTEVALAEAGYDVVGVVISGEEALDCAEELQPDLVLMDIRLAGELDGIETAILLQRKGFASVFASAHTDEGTKARGQEASPLGWLVKPFTPIELLAAVDLALKLH